MQDTGLLAGHWDLLPHKLLLFISLCASCSRGRCMCGLRWPRAAARSWAPAPCKSCRCTLVLQRQLKAQSRSGNNSTAGALLCAPHEQLAASLHSQVALQLTHSFSSGTCKHSPSSELHASQLLACQEASQYKGALHFCTIAVLQRTSRFLLLHDGQLHIGPHWQFVPPAGHSKGQVQTWA